MLSSKPIHNLRPRLNIKHPELRPLPMSVAIQTTHILNQLLHSRTIFCTLRIKESICLSISRSRLRVQLQAKPIAIMCQHGAILGNFVLLPFTTRAERCTRRTCRLTLLRTQLVWQNGTRTQPS